MPFFPTRTNVAVDTWPFASATPRTCAPCVSVAIVPGSIYVTGTFDGMWTFEFAPAIFACEARLDVQY